MNRKHVWPNYLLAAVIGLHLLPARADGMAAKTEGPPPTSPLRHKARIRHQRLHSFRTATVTVEIQRGQMIIRPHPDARQAPPGQVVTAAAH